MATVQNVLLLKRMGLMDSENGPLLKWARSLLDNMVGQTNDEAVRLFEDNLYELNMPRPKEAMIAVMPHIFFPDDKVFRRKVYLYALMAPVDQEAREIDLARMIIDKFIDPAMIDKTLAGQICMAEPNGEFIEILKANMRIKPQLDKMSVAYPMQTHPVVTAISTVSITALMGDERIYGQGSRKN